MYWLDFTPATGHEMTGPHPCVIVQNDVGNKFGGLTIVVAVTSALRAAALPVGVFLPAGTAGRKNDSVAHCGHVYTVGKNRVRNKIGDLPAGKLIELDRAMTKSLGLIP